MKRLVVAALLWRASFLSERFGEECIECSDIVHPPLGDAEARG